MPNGEESYGERLPWWARDLQRRLERIEEVKPDVLADNVKSLSDEIKSLRRSFYTFAFATVGSAILFAFTVFSLLGNSPP